MSNRKRRGRRDESTRDIAQPTTSTTADQPDSSPPALHPPQRHIVLLAACSLLYLVWIAFLAYVAIFG